MAFLEQSLGLRILLFACRKKAVILKRELPTLATKIKMIYNLPPDIPLIKKCLVNPTLLYVGGDNYCKGFYIFLKASTTLLRNGHNLNFFNKKLRRYI
jgi:hypothetical protein